MRLDLRLAERWIKPQSRVLDLGCGDGSYSPIYAINLTLKVMV